ncbi:flotillin-2 isoform X1 [Pristis pectinata]|uniref:flotillin-2 isoform X1 n=1 Tax=Pristis pectinata TaxID=685728 RepID=UPI00223D0446|nr:flotillin-2 isoform X1 [Pristis pectinata]
MGAVTSAPLPGSGAAALGGSCALLLLLWSVEGAESGGQDGQLSHGGTQRGADRVRWLLWIRPKAVCHWGMGLGLVVRLTDTEKSSEETSKAEMIKVKVMTDQELLAVACEQFLGKSVTETKSVVLQTLEGHLRAILGTLTVEAIYQDRDQFAQLVREVAAPDVGRMGIEILSFTIKDVYDKVEYLSSLGKSQTAVVQRDAEIGVAEAERDAGIREAECKKEAMDVKYSADTKMADSKRAFEMQKAAFNQEINTKKAEAQLAYELQGAKEQQKIRQEEIEIEVVQRKKQIDIEEKEIVRMDKELIGTVKRPAEAEAFRMQQIAEGQKVKQVLIAQAQAEKIRKIGEAEASSIAAIGKADAERMRLKAAGYQQYGDAAKMAMVLDALPKIAAEIAAPLAKTDEIVILGGDSNRVTSEVTRLLAEVPASVQALTGVDLSKVPLIHSLTNAQA